MGGPRDALQGRGGARHEPQGQAIRRLEVEEERREENASSSSGGWMRMWRWKKEEEEEKRRKKKKKKKKKKTSKREEREKGWVGDCPSSGFMPSAAAGALMAD